MTMTIRLMSHMEWVNEEGYTRAAVRCEEYSVDDYHGAWFGGYWYPDI